MSLDTRKKMIIYTTAICNLNCVYCFIDKNSALQKIDKYLDDSYNQDEDYYFNFSKELFKRDKLEEMQFWGGEPFLAMHRAYKTVDKCINYYPNLKDFMASTNFVSKVFFDEFYGLIKILGKYPERKFTFRLQISCDGPEYITDPSRGVGVTKKIQEHFPKLISELQEILPDNVTLSAFFKPTYDNSTIEKLQNKQRVIEYFQFFEEFNNIFLSINKKSNLKFSLPLPNTATPSPHTKQDGINFANYCRITREIEKENDNKKYFKYYKKITSFPIRGNSYKKDGCYQNCNGYCGNGYTTLGLLPDKMISCCHNGFVDLISDYKKKVLEDSIHMSNVSIDKALFQSGHNKLIFKANSKEFDYYEKRIEEFVPKNNTAKIVNMASMIRLLAINNQIDKKYAKPEASLKAANFVSAVSSYCVRDNLSVTGSIYMYPVGLLKLFLNGAKEYIEE